MKTFFLSVFFLFFSSKNDICVEGLKLQYLLNQNIVFKIKNNDGGKCYYYVSVECFKDNKWVEIITDITRPKSKSARLFIIGSDEVVSKNVSVQKVIYPEILEYSTKFRFKVMYGRSIDDINFSCFSNSFYILKPVY